SPPKGGNCRRAPTAEGRQLPKSANCRRARTAEGRELPKSANCRRARTAEGRELPKGANCRRRQLPKSANRLTARRLADRSRFCVVRQFALFGSLRCSA